MMKIHAKRSKTTQYVIGGTVAVIILGLWVSLPLMNGSSMDASVSTGNPFHSKVADISSLGSDIPSEGGAPGSPMSGEMINNPATSGEEMASSLFQSGLSEDEPAAAEVSADASAFAPPPAVSAAPVSHPSSGSGAKLGAVASITAGNSNSMTAGGIHNKFFGSGAGQKAEFAPTTGADMKKMAAADKKPALLAMLNTAADKSQLAVKTGNIDAAKGGAAAAFGATTKAGSSDLNENMENQSSSSGLQLGQTAQDLKKNDPNMSKHKVNIPEPKPVKDDKSDEEMKKMLMQMIIQNVLGPMFGAMGASMFPATPAAK
ncbi:MAG: hypothetical protein A2X35_01275 [Elusimicrobia bacterium GWA2_61_42]|nr:MAG: hypothetical protein A2X35_01275 [Elusimicrobia bacterium GWA2_61_42]OGR76299.1 MAG: hypothetical protein A2X38_05140 [Elusimicrobia bacterium GWC2_61_25]